MARRTVVTMPGDGIGQVVLPEAVRVLEAVGFDADYVHGDVGWEYWVHEGNALPDRTVELLQAHGLGLFGAITSKPGPRAEAELAPELRDRGLVYFSPIIGMRQRFGMDVCIRPCRSFPGNPLNFVRRTGSGDVEEPQVDAVVFRQNTEGMYVGVEWTAPPPQVLAALGTHERFRPFADVAPEDLAITTRIFTRRACRRIVGAAFRYARSHGYPSVTVCEKTNVLRETSGMLEDVAAEVQGEFPEIRLHSANIDALMMWITKRPEDYGVLVAGNMFGDILSDAFAGLVGGLGFVASGNIGDDVAVFEPTHGSAPKYAAADPPFVNPIAMILTAAMMLDHVGETDRSQRIRDTVAAVVLEGRDRTYDMLRLPGGPDALDRGAVTTTRMTDAILERL
jgi:3-isopropylmalate dehydrogenase